MMIKLTNSDGRDIYVATNNIARITEAGPSSQWHGIRSFVRTVDGATIECQETPNRIVNMTQSAAIETFRDKCIDTVAMHGGSVEIEAAIRAIPV